MIKKLLILFLLAMPWPSQAQSLFGYSPTELREKWPGVQWEYEKWGKENSLLMMSFSQERLRVSYFFDNSNKSIVTTITPLTQGELQSIVEIYNKRYVIVDGYTWRFYDEGSIYLCKLNHIKDDKYYFMWTIEK